MDNFPEVKRKLELLANRTVDNMKKHIKRSGKYNTGQLYNSVGWKYISGGSGGIMFYVSAPYAKYVMEGRKHGSKRPPSIEIRKWLSTPHGRTAFNSMKKKWKNITLEGATYIVCKSIGEKGIKKVDFMKPAFDGLYSTNVFRELESAFVNDIETQLKNNIK